MNSEKKSNTLKIRNGTMQDIKVIIEPYYELYKVEPGQFVKVVVTGGNQDDFFSTEYLKDAIIVCAWSDSEIAVLKDGKVMEPEIDRD